MQEMRQHLVIQTVRDVMTEDPLVLEVHATVAEAARAMTAHHIGDVLVGKDGKLVGIVTDRDLVVRCLAKDARKASDARLGEICTRAVVTLDPDAELGEAVRLMEERAVRRIPVTQDGELVGIVSLGDLALARDSGSALARISAAQPSK